MPCSHFRESGFHFSERIAYTHNKYENFAQNNVVKKLFTLILSVLCASCACVFSPIDSGAAEAQSVVYVSESATTDGVKLPILMYHAVYPDGAQRLPYSINKGDLIADFEYIKANGYTPISVKTLQAYTGGSLEKLPEKPVMLTFDDGFFSNVSIVLPLLEKYNYCALFAVTGSYSEEKGAQDDKFGYLRAEDIKKLAESPKVEICPHSYKLHDIGHNRGALERRGESKEAFLNRFNTDLNKTEKYFDEAGVNFLKCFVYPFGFNSAKTEEALKANGYFATFTTAEKTNVISRGSSLYLLSRYNRDRKSAEAILTRA
jgi:peptidoglycan/xylan/chitin deacetylase (PgdA/CDA1 family)